MTNTFNIVKKTKIVDPYDDKTHVDITYFSNGTMHAMATTKEASGSYTCIYLSSRVLKTMVKDLANNI